MDIFSKNREREDNPSFANINLLGPCNANCYFCLGKDLGSLIDNRHDIYIHYYEWPNFDKFIALLKEKNVKKVYITGQNTDALLYDYLEELIHYLQEYHGFSVGLRTNGRLALSKMNIINSCKDEVGYSINSLKQDVTKTIMGWNFVLDWDTILSQTKNPRVSTVFGRYNCDELLDIIQLIKNHPHIQYYQARRISTDTRKKELNADAVAYEELFERVNLQYPLVKEFYGAPIYDINGVETTFWRTVKTTISSINYFTDGTLSDKYFIVEGYLKNRK
jgi:MoaA/NifB/PqqE/SkfB family radical SAM enzyme